MARPYFFLALAFCFSVYVLRLQGQNASDSFADRPFNDHWSFLRGDPSGAEKSDFDDHSWRVLDLPHDWSIEDLPRRDQDPLFTAITLVPGAWSFSPGDQANWSRVDFSDAGWAHVTLPEPWEKEGVTQPQAFGWYRRHFTIPASARGKTVFIDLGVIHDQNWTYVDGTQVQDSGKDYWSNSRIKSRVVELSGDKAAPGDHVVAVRIRGGDQDGGIVATSGQPDGPSPCDPGRSAGNISTGYAVGGTGWYRKHFTVQPADAKGKVRLVFGGSYMETTVWLNGVQLGRNVYGYSPFAFDLTPALKPAGQDNVVAVRVDNLGANSRWYSGSGIFRPVHLEFTGADRIHLWGIAITTPEVEGDTATVHANVQLDTRENDSPATVQLQVFDPTGNVVADKSVSPRAATAGPMASFDLRVAHPQVWSPDSPSLYRAQVTYRVNDQVVDEKSSSFGIRTLTWSANRGLLLNGVSIKLRGGCVHHDFGPLGSASFPLAEERRVSILKSAGYNAIRCSHNMPSTAFLDACDRLGMLVIDEAFDMWNIPKNPMDYSRYFKTWSTRDLAAMINRDRNHPSIVMWSIGNEIPERFDPPGVATAKRLANQIRSIDPTRPVTAAFNDDSPAGDPFLGDLDICGYNYSPDSFEVDHRRVPGRIMFTTESYPKDSFHYWSFVERDPYVIGDFIWTAWDYRGESGIGHTVPTGGKSSYLVGWPYDDAFCGDFDVCGFVKPQSLYRQVMWDARKVAIEVDDLPPGQKSTPDLWGWRDELPSWNFPGTEGQPRAVRVYSKGDSVKLSLNGKEIATNPVDGQLTASFSVNYQPGQLTAQVMKNGQIVAQDTLQTAGAPATLRLSAYHPTIPADRQSVAFVTIEGTDGSGNVNPDAVNPVQVSLTGPGEIIAFGNGDPTNVNSVQSRQEPLWRGRNLLVIRSTGAPGPIDVVARSSGMPDATLRIQAQ